MLRQGDTETVSHGDRVKLRVSVSPPLLVSLSLLHFLCGYTSIAAGSVDAAELVPLEGAPVEAELQAVDSNRVTLWAKPPLSLPLEEFVRWGYPQPPRPQTIVVLADGGRLVTAAAWSGGAAVRLEGESLVVLSDTFD